MPFEIVKHYTRAEIIANPEKLYIFGDNDERRGTSGQAGEARDLGNTVGIRTKRAQTHEPADFYSDTNYSNNVRWLVRDLDRVFDALHCGRVVVWPVDGVGTGVAKLQEKAPLTLRLIRTVIASLMRIYGTIDAHTGKVKHTTTMCLECGCFNFLTTREGSRCIACAKPVNGMYVDQVSGAELA